jgi:hypothetical protein
VNLRVTAANAAPIRRGDHVVYWTIAARRKLDLDRYLARWS